MRAAFWLREPSDTGLSETLPSSSPSHGGKALKMWCCSALAAPCLTSAPRCDSSRIQSVIKQQSVVAFARSRPWSWSPKLQFYLLEHHLWVLVGDNYWQLRQPSWYSTVRHLSGPSGSTIFLLLNISSTTTLIINLGLESLLTMCLIRFCQLNLDTTLTFAWCLRHHSKLGINQCFSHDIPKD